ncbi:MULTISPECIES: nuclear transport factor 2 family protein [unclassified Mycobacterium]|nr:MULTISPECIES: nuclear transport factor 2 family protein [unclassified Mycobacterium]
MDSARANIELLKAWLDAHNRGDITALEYMSNDVEIVEMPTGVVWRGRQDMENLARLAYSRKSHKRLTHIFATETAACMEYVTVVSMAGEVSPFEKEWGLHGIDISRAEPTSDVFELPVCFVCEIKDGRIHRAREYWDAASASRQLGVHEQQDNSGH